MREIVRWEHRWCTLVAEVGTMSQAKTAAGVKHLSMVTTVNGGTILKM
jgi:hypothetical protein